MANHLPYIPKFSSLQILITNFSFLMLVLLSWGGTDTLHCTKKPHNFHRLGLWDYARFLDISKLGNCIQWKVWFWKWRKVSRLKWPELHFFESNEVSVFFKIYGCTAALELHFLSCFLIVTYTLSIENNDFLLKQKLERVWKCMSEDLDGKPGLSLHVVFIFMWCSSKHCQLLNCCRTDAVWLCQCSAVKILYFLVWMIFVELTTDSFN
jgi:hypothetical protein